MQLALLWMFFSLKKQTNLKNKLMKMRECTCYHNDLSVLGPNHNTAYIRNAADIKLYHYKITHAVQ